jgi:hypothetical protein
MEYNTGKLITIAFLVMILMIFGSYIYNHFYVSKYFVKNTFGNEFDFIRSRLGLLDETRILGDKKQEQMRQQKGENQFKNITFDEKEENLKKIPENQMGGTANTLADTVDHKNNSVSGDGDSMSVSPETPAVAEDIPSGKKGWCNIGTDRGYRSCVYLGINDKCMSGEIFPTREVCIHPNLRV